MKSSIALEKTLSVYVACLTLAMVVLIGCKTSNQAKTSAPSNKPDSPEFTELIDLLRRQGGMDIRGYGNDVYIVIRGNKTLGTPGADQPLFVVNGTPVGHGYASVEGAVDVQTVKSISVLPAARAGRYGSRGAFGVIEIITK